MDNKKNDKNESRFLEAPFVRMLRMRSASLKTKPLHIGIQISNIYLNFGRKELGI